MKVYFQMIGSESPATIAEVESEVDIDSFRRDEGWYEVEEPKKPRKVEKEQK